jgi:hypothetical protein
MRANALFGEEIMTQPELRCCVWVKSARLQSLAGGPAERLAGAQAKQEVKQLTTKLQSRDLEPQPGRTLMESFEAGVNQVRRSLGAGRRMGAGRPSRAARAL